MRRKLSWLALSLVLGLFATSCIGPMNAVRRTHVWNREIENRWAGEGLYLLLRAVGWYPLCSLGDLLIFNSIEFWGGTNPIDPPSIDRLKAIAQKDEMRARAEESEAP